MTPSEEDGAGGRGPAPAGPAPGDIVRIYAASVGYHKYCLCLEPPIPPDAGRFIWMNSDPYARTYDVPCARVPCLPTSRTGLTCFSFSALVRHSADQMRLYQATPMGRIEADVARDLHAHAMVPANTETLGRRDAAILRRTLAAIAGQVAGQPPETPEPGA